MRRMMTKKRKISLIVLSVLLSAVLAASGFMIIRELSSRQKEKEDFRELAEIVTTTPTEPPETDTPSIDESVIEEEPQSGRNLSELFAMNDDCIGWLCIPGTAVDYPVMHTPENPQKYLRLNFYGEYSQSGVPFLDGRCSLDSDNLIIYGHNMKNGTMFSNLRYYTDPAFCAEHPTVEFETADGLKLYTVFDVRITDTSDEWYSEINTASDRFLTLSTCYGSSKNGRLLVIAKET